MDKFLGIQNATRLNSRINRKWKRPIMGKKIEGAIRNLPTQKPPNQMVSPVNPVILKKKTTSAS